MILITGGAWSGGEAYAAEHYPEAALVKDWHLEVRRQLAEGLDPLAEAEKLLVEDRRLRYTSGRPLAVVFAETGCGVVPADPGDRLWREAAGRVQCFLASHAHEVVRTVCGLGQVIKPRKHARICLVRHGRVPENLERRFVGSTDSSLIPGEADRLREMYSGIPGRLFPGGGPEAVYVSTLKRTSESAEALFPGIPKLAVPELREMDFGEYENRTHEELSGQPSYEAYLSSGGELPFPGGESKEEFTIRSCRAFLECMDRTMPGGKDHTVPGGNDRTVRGGYDRMAPECMDRTGAVGMDRTVLMGKDRTVPECMDRTGAVGMETWREAALPGGGAPYGPAVPAAAAFVVHGGTIMAVMSRFAGQEGGVAGNGDGGGQPRGFFDWMCGNGHGYAGYWDPVRCRITDIEELPGDGGTGCTVQF